MRESAVGEKHTNKSKRERSARAQANHIVRKVRMEEEEDEGEQRTTISTGKTEC